MKYKWLNKQTNNEIIIFFNGWGMDESVVSNLDPERYNVLMFYDYNTLDTDFDFTELNLYDSIHLVAWSMGVMVASLFEINYNTKTAINGTLEPISDEFGIPKRIYGLTLKGFSPKGAEKFLKTMFKEDTNLPAIKRDFENQKTELYAIKTYEANKNFKYDRVFISSDDKIIPTKNQTAFWKIAPNINSGHAPFNLFTKWSELL